MKDAMDWTERYRNERPKYEKLTRKLMSLLEEILEREGIKAVVECRTKELDSFKGKISRSGKTYSDPLSEVTDLSGVRIVLYSLSDVDQVANFIEREFFVDPDRSINKLDQLDPDKFGYLSQHFIVKVSESRRSLVEWADVSNLWAEIQVRTVLQHAWATVEHFLVYKNEIDAPRNLRRRLSRLSALFEMADEELDRLIQERRSQNAEYRVELDQGNAQIEINVDSLRAYIQSSIQPQYWINYLRNELGLKVNDDDWGNLSRGIKIAQFFGFSSIAEIDQLLADAHGWGERFLAKYFEDLLALDNLTVDRVTVVTDEAITVLMIASHAKRLTEQTLEQEFEWSNAHILLNNALSFREEE